MCSYAGGGLEGILMNEVWQESAVVAHWKIKTEENIQQVFPVKGRMLFVILADSDGLQHFQKLNPVSFLSFGSSQHYC